MADSRGMLALSIRQPYAELILSGIKTAEYRSRPTKIIGQRFWIYASRGGGDWRKKAGGVQQAAGIEEKTKAWSLDLAMAKDAAELPWMAELANALKLFPEELQTGVIVGSAVIEKVEQRDDGMYAWHLGGVERAKRLRKPAGHPQPVWFRAF